MLRDLADSEARAALPMKWGAVPEGTIPAWVAEMDFAPPPAVTADRMRVAEATGRQAGINARAGVTPDKILTEKAFENALRVLLAIGGSTNGIIHLTAIAGRMGIDIDLAAFDRMSRETPVLVDLKPSGQHYMEDLHRAGGLPTVLRELKPLLHLDAMTVTGRTLGEEIDAVPVFEQQVVHRFDTPLYHAGGIAFVRGNLAPDGAIIKQSAADARLMEHEGRAVVFEDAEDMAARIDDPELDVTAEDVLVLKRIGPVGAPGMPEAGYLPIPRKLARQGVRDMLRISDGSSAKTILRNQVPGSPQSRATTARRLPTTERPGRVNWRAHSARNSTGFRSRPCARTVRNATTRRRCASGTATTPCLSALRRRKSR